MNLDDIDSMLAEISGEAKPVRRRSTRRRSAPPAAPHVDELPETTGMVVEEAEVLTPGPGEKSKVSPESADEEQRLAATEPAAPIEVASVPAERVEAEEGDEDLPEAELTEAEEGDEDLPETELTEAEEGDEDLPEAELAEAEEGDEDLPEAELAEAEEGDEDLPEAELAEAEEGDEDLPEAELAEAEEGDEDLPEAEEAEYALSDTHDVGDSLIESVEEYELVDLEEVEEIDEAEGESDNNGLLELEGENPFEQEESDVSYDPQPQATISFAPPAEDDSVSELLEDVNEGASKIEFFDRGKKEFKSTVDEIFAPEPDQHEGEFFSDSVSAVIEDDESYSGLLSQSGEPNPAIQEDEPPPDTLPDDAIPPGLIPERALKKKKQRHPNALYDSLSPEPPDANVPVPEAEPDYDDDDKKKKKGFFKKLFG